MKTKNREQRTITTPIELREMAGEQQRVIGYASTFEPYDMGDYIERIDRKAFNRTLENGADVRLLINHDGLPLARTKSGTLSLSVDDVGLRYEALLDLSSNTVNDLVSALRRGDINQSSFGFFVQKDKWGMDKNSRKPIRTIQEIEVFDTSIVTYPANPTTTAGLRSLFQDGDKLKDLFDSPEEIAQAIEALKGLLPENIVSEKKEINYPTENLNNKAEDSAKVSDSANEHTVSVESPDTLISAKARDNELNLI